MNRSDRIEIGRYFLKDTIRQQTDFSETGQARQQPPPPLQKPCPAETVRINLPDGATALKHLAGLSVAEAILCRESVRNYTKKPLSLETITALLWATQGVREVLSPACALRTVPSAGARHAFETYLAVSRVDELRPGLYRYLPFNNQLAQLRLDSNIGAKAAHACLGQSFVADAAATFFWTTVPARMEWRYGMAAHKVIALDVGHVCQNLYLACTALHAGTCAIAAYDQSACDQLLDVDGKEEFTVYISSVGEVQ
jgi:SagB-type dehydrogenase family enzyme